MIFQDFLNIIKTTIQILLQLNLFLLGISSRIPRSSSEQLLQFLNDRSKHKLDHHESQRSGGQSLDFLNILWLFLQLAAKFNHLEVCNLKNQQFFFPAQTQNHNEHLPDLQNSIISASMWQLDQFQTDLNKYQKSIYNGLNLKYDIEKSC